MFHWTYSILVLLFLIVMSTSTAEWVEMEAGGKHKFDPLAESDLESHNEFLEDAAKEDKHSVTFHLFGRNAELLERTVAEVSDPKHPRYGKYLTKEEVHEMTADVEGQQKVLSYLEQLSQEAEASGLGTIQITKKTDSTITAEAKIGVWEKAFNTVFFKVRHTDHRDGSTQVINRAKKYFLPEHLVPHVRMVMGTVQMPVPLSRGPIRRGGPRPTV